MAKTMRQSVLILFTVLAIAVLPRTVADHESRWLNRFYNDPEESNVEPVPSPMPVSSPPTASPAPVTEAPVISAPTSHPTIAPVTLAPVTLAPVTQSPVTPAPVTQSPVTQSPVTPAPVTPAPVTPAPASPVTSIVIEMNPDCKVNADGSFGDSSSAFEISVQYFYELEMIANPDESQDEILQDLENGIADAVLSVLFPDACARRMLRSVTRRRLQAVGLSTKPLDEELVGVPCSVAKERDDNLCHVFLGKMTVYANTGTSTIIADSLSQISESMSSGSLIGTNPAIVRVTYADSIPTTVVVDDPPTNEGNSAENNASSSRLGTGAYVGMGVALIAVVGATAFLIRKRRSRRVPMIDVDSEPPRAAPVKTTIEIDSAPSAQ